MDNIIIASNVAPLGKVADQDDLKVIQSQQPLAEVTRSGDRLAVEVPLLEASRRTVGALAVQLAFKAGVDQQVLTAAAVQLRDKLARRISHLANLVEPANYDARVPMNHYGQQLVDETMAANPDIQILARRPRQEIAAGDRRSLGSCREREPHGALRVTCSRSLPRHRECLGARRFDFLPVQHPETSSGLSITETGRWQTPQDRRECAGDTGAPAPASGALSPLRTARYRPATNAGSPQEAVTGGRICSDNRSAALRRD
jgi:hypothetical protein